MEKEEKILLDIYRKMYSKSTPKADFDELMKNSPRNEFGQIEIPYKKHSIKEEDAEKIICDELKKYNLPDYKKRRIRQTVWLGCSPVFSK